MRRKQLKKPPDGSERTCIATRISGPPSDLVRFALSPDGIVTPDLGSELPGRGAWVSATRDAIVKAAGTNQFSRAFKTTAALPDRLDAEAFADYLAGLIEKRALSAIGLARKAGEVVTGFDQVSRSLKDSEIAVLITAADAAEDGAAKLQRLARTGYAVRGFSVDTLSGALGRDGVRHLGLKNGAGAKRFLSEAKRLASIGRDEFEISRRASAATATDA